MHSNLDIVLDRDGLRPEDLDAEELGRFLENFAILLRKASGREGEVATGLAAIEDNCIRLRFLASRAALAGYAVFVAFESESLKHRPVASREWNKHIEEINRFCERNRLQATFPLNGKKGDTLKIRVIIGDVRMLFAAGLQLAGGFSY